MGYDPLRQQAGLRAKRRGMQFEGLIETFARLQGVTCQRIPDGCKQVSATKLIRVKTPFDFILGAGERVVFCDAKSTEGKTFPHSKIDEDQLYALERLARHRQFAGLIVLFSSVDLVVFYSVALLKTLKPEDSLKPSQGVLVGKITSMDLNGFIARL